MIDVTAEAPTIDGEDEADDEDHLTEEDLQIGTIEGMVAMAEIVGAEAGTDGVSRTFVTEVLGETGDPDHAVAEVDGMIAENFEVGGEDAALVILVGEAIMILLSHPPAEGVLGVVLAERMVAGVAHLLAEDGKQMGLDRKVRGRQKRLTVVGQILVMKSEAGGPRAQVEVEVVGVDHLRDQDAVMEAVEVAGEKLSLTFVRYINFPTY